MQARNEIDLRAKPSPLDTPVSLESILCTDELSRRPRRPPDYEKESRALAKLSLALADSPRTILQELAETILETLHVGSAGVSLLTIKDGGKRFHWPAIAGAWKPHIGGGTPRDFGPCGDVLDRNSHLLFKHVERRYTYFSSVTPPAEEALLVPFHVGGKAVGTIWAVTHDDTRKLDNEDLRQLVGLSRFASSAFQARSALEALDENGEVRDGLASIVDSSDDAIVSNTLDGTITRWNRAAERMFGYTAAEAVGQHITLIIPTELHAESSEMLERLRRGENVTCFETERQGKDGRRVTIALTISSIMNAAGTIIGASKVARDITARKRMESDLRASEIRYRRLFQTAKDGILILDAETGKIIDANAFMCGLLGLDVPDIVGKELWEIGLFEDIAANKSAFEKLRHNGYIRYDHLPVQKPNGERTQVEFVSNVYKEGSRLVAQCNVRDITERAAMEDQIKTQAEALADQARRKDEFLAMLSHELRNPLAPIRSATHLLRLQERGSENLIQQQAREVIERQVTTLTRLVSDLLEVSRALTGQIRLSLETVDLNQVVQHALATAQPLIEQGDHRLSVNLSPHPLWATVDSTRMEEVFVNLLSNAAKFTNQGGHIEVTCEHRPGYAVVRVRDDGAGIDHALLPHIFDLFTQANRTLDRAKGGLGIGLSLAHRIIEMHGGLIEAHSAGAGKGSEFVVRVQLTPAPGVIPPPPANEPARQLGLRVLVVDDNVDACTMLANLLRLRGYGVQTAHTGSAALAAAQTWRPDVVLLDIGLPEIDGYEVARRLRAADMTRSMKLVAVTGYGTEDDRQLGQEAGFDSHLLKPAHLADIEELFAAWKEERPPRALQVKSGSPA